MFGSSTNSKGFKVIKGAGVIQGDGINVITIGKILQAVVGEGFSAENVAFGMGGGLLQRVNRYRGQRGGVDHWGCVLGCAVVCCSLWVSAWHQHNKVALQTVMRYHKLIHEKKCASFMGEGDVCRVLGQEGR